jgi:epsilon-lactone hydrolase
MMLTRLLPVLVTTFILAASASSVADESLDQVIRAYKEVVARNAKTVDEWREVIAEGADELIKVDGDIKVESVDAGGVRAEWVVPPNANPNRVLMYMHGGGYIMCSAEFHRGLVARIARAAGVRALNVDYRLAPEHPFPAAVDDATDAYRWLISDDNDNGVKPDQIVMAGDSAGGGLTLATLVKLRDAGIPLPSAAVCISPWVDLAMTGRTMSTKSKADPYVRKDLLQFMARNYLGDTDPRTPLASPLYADLRGLPPLLIHVGSVETLLSDATRIAERAGEADVNPPPRRTDAQQHGRELRFFKYQFDFKLSVLPKVQRNTRISPRN